MKVQRVVAALAALGCGVSPLAAQGALPEVPASRIELQPFAKLNVERIVGAMQVFGSPLEPGEVEALEEALEPGAEDVARVQALLDQRALCVLLINPESRVKVHPGPASEGARLLHDGARNFLVKIINEGGVTGELRVESDEACVDAEFRTERPMSARLSGLELEYAIVSIVGRSPGTCAVNLRFDVGPWSRDLGFRSTLAGVFRTGPNQTILLNVLDSEGNPTTGRFVVKDTAGTVYPPLMTRLEPDFRFHDQVYRSDGETLSLPQGAYTVTFQRGPESLPEVRPVVVDGSTTEWTFQETRWVDTRDLGYESLDHHLHPAGCSHYDDPTCGVTPASMAKHCEGEDVNAESLIWGPCYNYQKDFLVGVPYDLGTPPGPAGFLGYGLETSGLTPGGVPVGRVFGHLFFLGLQSTHPTIDDFPTRALPILRWGEQQGAVIGYAHSGAGMHAADAVPNYIVPPVNNVGAVSAPVYVTEEPVRPSRSLAHAGPVPVGDRFTTNDSLIDLLGVCNTSYSAELNLWYHLLACGFRVRIAGESDFPCIYDDRVGRGRTYVKTEGQAGAYHAFLADLARGRSYVGTGECHLVDFRLTPSAGGTTVKVGEEGSEARLAAPGTVDVLVDVIALLPPTPPPGAPSMSTPVNQTPYWSLERARVVGTRQVDVEIVVNGLPVATTRILANGTQHALQFNGIQIDCSSWVAVRVLGAAHTNPVFVLVDGAPIRTSKRSAQWCIDVIDRFLTNKMPLLDAFPTEQAEVEAVAARARRVFKRIKSEAKDDL